MALTQTQIYQIRHAASLGQAQLYAKAWGVDQQQLADILRDSGLATVLQNVAKQHKEAGTAIPKQSLEMQKLLETHPTKTIYTALGDVAKTLEPQLTDIQKDKLKTASSLAQAWKLAQDYGISEAELKNIVGDMWFMPGVVAAAGVEEPIGEAKATIPVTQAELDQIAQAKAKGLCVGAMKTYYTIKTYKVGLYGGGTITVEAMNRESAREKAEAAGYKVVSISVQIGEIKPEDEVVTDKSKQGKDLVKDYYRKFGTQWKDEYVVEGGYNLVAMLKDAEESDILGDITKHELRELFGYDTVSEAEGVLIQYKAYEELEPYIYTVPSDLYKWVPSWDESKLTYTDEIRIGELISDKGEYDAIVLLKNAGVVGVEEFIDSYNNMPEQWRLYADEYGFITLQFKVNNCIAILKDYKQPDGSYDIYQALLDPKDWMKAKSHQDAIDFMFGSEVTDQALGSLCSMRAEVTAPYPVPGDQVAGKDVKTIWGKTQEALHPVGVALAGANPLPLWVMDNPLTPAAQAYMAAYDKEMPLYKRFLTGLAFYYISENRIAKIMKEEAEANGVDVSKGLFLPVVGGYGPMIIPAVGGVGAAIAGVGQKVVKIPKWYWKAPANVIMKLAAKVPGLLTIPLIKTIPQMTIMAVRALTVAVPAYYTAAYIAERVKDSDLQRKWNLFSNLPESEKNKWARKCGYAEWEGLTEGQQSVVLARYAVPTSYTTTEWSMALGEYTEELVKFGEKGSSWLLGQQTPASNIQEMSIGGAPVKYIGAFGLGTGVGFAEGLMYMAAIPLVMTNILVRVPTGEAWGYTKWVASGMMEFFAQVPATLVSGPFGAGRMIGLFVLSPEAVYKVAKGGVTSIRYGYIPERGMARPIHTLRVVFSAKQLDILSEMSSAELKFLGTRIGAVLMKGKKFIKKFGNIRLEVDTVPYQKVVGNVLFHFTPDITPFLKGKQVPIVGKLYGSPQAAIFAGIQSLVKGVKATKPGLVEIRVPKGYTIKGAPVEKLLAGGRAVEIEAPLKGTLDPIPGLTGKGVSSNVYFGSYPIRRFTLHGVDTPIVKLTPAKLAKIRVLAMQEAIIDFFLGWSGRLEAIKKDIAGSKQLKGTLKNIDGSIKSIKTSQDSIVGKNGEIVSQIEFRHPSSGLISEKVRGLIIDKNGRVLFTRDRADPVNVYDAVGGSCNVKEVLIPSKGKWNYELLTKDRPVVTWELAFRSQAFGELLISPKKVKSLGMYRGKVGEHSVYGVRIFEAKVDTPYFNRVKAWERYQRAKYKYGEPEIADAFWWDGKSSLKAEVQPWFYDMLAAVARKYGWDMSKVKISKVSGNFVRDVSFPERVSIGKNPDLTTAQRKAFELDRLKSTYGELMMPSFRDYVLKSGADLTLISELIKGRRQAVKWVATEPTNLVKAGDYLVKSLSSLKDRIRKMSPRIFEEEYGGLGVSKGNLLKSLDTLRLIEALKKYKSSKTKINEKSLQTEINKLTQKQVDLVNRWLTESNIKDYLDYASISGRYAVYLERYARAAAAGINPEYAPIWTQLPRYEVQALPPANYVLEYAYYPDERRAFTYTTQYSMPKYTDLNRYPNYAKQPEYRKAAEYYKPVKYVAPIYKAPEYKTVEYKPVEYKPVEYKRLPKEPYLPKQKIILIESKGKKYYKLPEGAIAWAMGKLKRQGELRPQWYYIPPPWTQEKPISLDYPPLGAKNTEGTIPKETIQMIGEPEAKVPKDVAIDLGIVDIYISDYGRKIRFAGEGEKTVVGKSLAEATKGMSIPGHGRMVVKKKKRSNGRRREAEAAISVGR